MKIPNFIDFKGKTAIVIGGASGLGAAISIMFLEYGANVLVVGRHKEKLKSFKKTTDTKKYNGKLFIKDADSSLETDLKNIIFYLKKNNYSMDYLVNCSGEWREQPIEKIKIQDIESMFNNNLRSIILSNKIIGMNLKEGGSIVNMGSFASILSIKNGSLYSSFKAAVSHFTKSSAAELSKRKVRVNCLIPGVIETPMTRDYISNNYQRLIKPIALGRLGSTRDVANGVLFLCSDKSSYITGTQLVITGGKYLTQI